MPVRLGLFANILGARLGTKTISLFHRRQLHFLTFVLFFTAFFLYAFIVLFLLAFALSPAVVLSLVDPVSESRGGVGVAKNKVPSSVAMLLLLKH